MIHLEINEQKVAIEEGAMIIEAADKLGIYIPRYCYHKKLSIAANCRMCLVEVEGARGPAAACATMVTEGMKVYTTSKTALDAQKAVMEFLLLNHPLDCPICDQGGECELQDQAVGYGLDYSDYEMTKRSVAGDDLGPLIETEMTRCIHCTRCVRFGIEIAGAKELGLTGRGENTKIGTYVDHLMESELSGNVIDICPVGALTSKPFRFQARAWEMQSHASVSPHDCVGTNLYHHTRGHEHTPAKTLMRTVPRENEGINECWIADRDRFGYLGLSHADRVTQPLVKRSGQWKETTWEQALLEIADRIQAIVQHQGPDQLAALVSPSATMEEGYLLQKVMRLLGSSHIDYRVHQSDFSDQADLSSAPGFSFSLNDIDGVDQIFLVGGYTRDEQPILSHRINKAAQEGVSVMTLAAAHYRYKFTPAQEAVCAPNGWAAFLREVAVALDTTGSLDKSATADVTVSDDAKAFATALLDANRPLVILGLQALHHAAAAEIRRWAALVATLSGAQMGLTTDGANSAGLDWVGCVPHRDPFGKPVRKSGLTAKEVLSDKPVRGYFLYGVEPACDVPDASSAMAVLEDAGLVVSFSAFQSDAMRSYADFILPIAPYTESAGSYMNVEKHLQSFAATSVPAGDARPGWKVLRALAHFLNCEGMAYDTIEDVRRELQYYHNEQTGMYQAAPTAQPLAEADDLSVLPVWPLYRTDALVRRAGALQAARPNEKAAVRLSSTTAASLGIDEGVSRVDIQQGDQTQSCDLVRDDRLADQTVFLTMGFDESAAWRAGIPVVLSATSTVEAE